MTKEEETLFSGLEKMRVEAEKRDPQVFVAFKRYTESGVLFSQVLLVQSHTLLRTSILLPYQSYRDSILNFSVGHGHGTAGLLRQLRHVSICLRGPLLLGEGVVRPGLLLEGGRLLPGDSRQVRMNFSLTKMSIFRRQRV